MVSPSPKSRPSLQMEGEDRNRKQVQRSSIGNRYRDCWRFIYQFEIIVLTLSFLHSSGTCSKTTPNDDPHIYSSPSSWVNSYSEKGATMPWEMSENIVPLSLQEYEQRLAKRTISLSSSSNSNSLDDTKRSKSKTRKSSKQSTGSSPSSGDSVLPDDEMHILRKKALDFGLAVLKVMKELFFQSPLSQTESARGFFTGFPHNVRISRQENEEGGGGEAGGGHAHDHDHGVIDWLARLIGVQGKTLGEFLREYQVHVLYDLVFTFFKWIFFLYAGLLIP